MDLSELSEKIVEALRARNVSGETYSQMEKISGVSGSYIHSLANHQCAPLKLSLEKFFKLFPSAQISLSGAAPFSGVPAADMVPRSELLDLRERYADLRDQYQDLREKYLDLKSRPPYLLDGPASAAPYHTSASSKSK